MMEMKFYFLEGSWETTMFSFSKCMQYDHKKLYLAAYMYAYSFIYSYKGKLRVGGVEFILL